MAVGGFVLALTKFANSLDREAVLTSWTVLVCTVTGVGWMRIAIQHWLIAAADSVVAG